MIAKELTLSTCCVIAAVVWNTIAMLLMIMMMIGWVTFVVWLVIKAFEYIGKQLNFSIFTEESLLFRCSDDGFCSIYKRTRFTDVNPTSNYYAFLVKCFTCGLLRQYSTYDRESHSFCWFGVPFKGEQLSLTISELEVFLTFSIINIDLYFARNSWKAIIWYETITNVLKVIFFFRFPDWKPIRMCMADLETCANALV